MIHHLFVDGAVVSCAEWGEVQHFLPGTFGYTPADEVSKWYTLNFPRWTLLSKDQVPKEFLTQLVLLGIPIHD